MSLEDCFNTSFFDWVIDSNYPKSKEIFIDRESYRIDHVRDMISSDGSILRLIRVFKLR